MIQNPDLFRSLITFLRKDGRPQEELDRFAERWSRLRAHDAYPCPLCYLDRDDEQPLAALPAIGNVEPVKCPTCRHQFDIPIPR